jgi:integrase
MSTNELVADTKRYRIDWALPEPVGRLNISLNTKNRQQFERRKVVLRKLLDDAQLDVLLAVKNGATTIEELVEADRAGRLKGAEILGNLKLRANLWTSIEEVLPSMGGCEDTRRRYRTSLRLLQTTPDKPLRKKLGSKARVLELTAAPWTQLRATWQRTGKSAADWNHLRRAVSRFLTILLGDVQHPFRREVMKLIPTAKEGRGRTPELTVEGFWSIIEAIPPHARPCIVTLAATGMRSKEYLLCSKTNLNPATCAIAVPGTKTADSADTVYVARELWPWIEAGIPSPLQSRWIHIYWWRACVQLGFGRYEPVMHDGVQVMRTVKLRNGKTKERPATRYAGLRIHDLRHVFAQVASDAGAPTAKVQAALRHSDPAMTRRYEMRRAKGEVAQLVGRALTGNGQRNERVKRTGPVQSRPPKRAATRWRQLPPAKSPAIEVHGAKGTVELSRYVPGMAREGIEPPTRGFSVRCSTN